MIAGDPMEAIPAAPISPVSWRFDRASDVPEPGQPLTTRLQATDSGTDLGLTGFPQDALADASAGGLWPPPSHQASGTTPKIS